jgi:uncharacterized membrane protein
MSGGVAWGAGLLLPLLFWGCHLLHWPFWLCGIPLLLLAILMAWRSRQTGTRWLPAGIAAVIGSAAIISQSTLSLQLYPVLCNVFFFTIFTASLRSRQSVVERLARRLEPDFPAAAIPYTRRVTQAWCLFFLLNAALSLVSISAGEIVWALYNGVIAYLLMGLMFVCEWLIRQRVKRRIARSTEFDQTIHA